MLGYHQLENGVKRVVSNGTKFVVPDFQSIKNTSVQTGSQTTTMRRVQAISAQLELGYNNMAFLTLRGRNDWSSTLPKGNRSYFYPAVEASYVLTELPFLKDNNYVSYLKLRGSVAQVGKDAGPLEIYAMLEPTNQTGGGFRYGFTGNNFNLRPEKNTSKEIGFEAKLLNDRVNTDFTLFKTNSKDQIVRAFRASYASGYVLNNLNVGSFDTWGWEWHIDADIIRQKDFTWNVGFNASHTNSKVISLPDNITEYYNPYTWSIGNIRNGIAIGQPVTSLTARAYERNSIGQVLIDPKTGLPIVSTQWTVVGDREPKLRFGITSNLSYQNLRFSAMFSGRYKTTVINGTKRYMMSNGYSMESLEFRNRGPVVINGVLKDGLENTSNPTPNTMAIDYKVAGTSIYTGNDEDWIEKNVNYLRLQEVRLSYRVPAKFLKGLSKGLISSTDLFISGNDLATWTNYSGLDAVGNMVSAAAGGTSAEGFDLFSLPNPRAISIGFSITFN